MPGWALDRSWPARGASCGADEAGSVRREKSSAGFPCTGSGESEPAGTDLEAIEVCVEDVSTLDVGDQSHSQLLIGLIPDVNHGADVDGQAVHAWKKQP